MPRDVSISKKKARIVVTIPAYNEAGTVGEVIKKAKNYADEVIVYDDGSVDNTYEVAKTAGATVIRNPSNKGYGAAIKALFHIAREKNADIMITVDSDSQHNPDQIPRFIEPILRDGFDIVIGSRFLNQDDKEKVPAYRRLGIKTITRLTQSGSYNNITDAQSGFRAYNKCALFKLDPFEEGFASVTELLLRAKEKNLMVKEVPVTIIYNVEKPSTMNPLLQGAEVSYSIIHFISLRHPLAFYGLPGVILLLVATVLMYNTLELFDATRYLSTNMMLISVGTAVIGIVLLATAAIIYTIAALLKRSRGALYSITQFISLRHPLAFYGLPGVILLLVATVLMYNTLELFDATRYLSTNMMLISVGTAVIGIVLLATATIVYTLIALLRGVINET
jgi:glycosyltransferase involved in cell wall biosynthesis